MWRSISSRLLHPAIFGERRETDQVSAYLDSDTGVFVEVGAYDPEILSQTLHLENAGWRGILIEPLAERAELLRRRRKATVFEVAAGAPEDAGRLLPLQVAGALSTLRAEPRELKVRASETRMVPVRTLDSILEEAGIETVDFVSIDVEEAELDVLRGFSLERYRPRLVLIEDGMLHLDKHRHMLARGYKLVRRTALNNWYVPRAAEFPISAVGRLQFLRKLYLGLWLRRARRAIAVRRRARGDGRSQSLKGMA